MEKFLLLLEMGFASQNKEAMGWFSFTLCSLQSVGNLLQNINLTGNIITNNKHFFGANFDCKYFFASNIQSPNNLNTVELFGVAKRLKWALN